VNLSVYVAPTSSQALQNCNYTAFSEEQFICQYVTVIT